MTSHEAARQIRGAVANHDTYARYLVNVLNRMTAQQQYYFLDEVAPYYLEGPGMKKDMPFKDMEYMARAIERGKDVRQILGLDYKQINSYLDKLPDLSSYTPKPATPVQSERIQEDQVYSKFKTIRSIDALLNQYVRVPGYAEHGSFCQGPGNYDSIPQQGWKFHISATTLEDYEKLLKVALPELSKQGVVFKVVTPNAFESFQQGPQTGKNITIYPTPAFNINSFSPEFRAILSEDIGIVPNGDGNISGRINARYGKFRGEKAGIHNLIDNSGRETPDPRRQKISPDFVSERSAEDILNFYSDAANRYRCTGDYKNYVQEMALMTRGDGVNSPFVILEANGQNRKYIENVTCADPKGQSFMFELNGSTYAMIHNDYADRALADLDSLQVLYNRPEWDKRYNVFQIPREYINNGLDMVNNYNHSLFSNSEFGMKWVQLDDNTWGIKVETAMNRAFQEQCRMYGVATVDFALNRNSQELAMDIEKYQGIDHSGLQIGAR